MMMMAPKEKSKSKSKSRTPTPLVVGDEVGDEDITVSHIPVAIDGWNTASRIAHREFARHQQPAMLQMSTNGGVSCIPKPTNE